MTNPSDVTRPDEVEAPTYLEFSQNGSPPPLDINGFEGHPIPNANGTYRAHGVPHNVKHRAVQKASLNAGYEAPPSAIRW